MHLKRALKLSIIPKATIISPCKTTATSLYSLLKYCCFLILSQQWSTVIFFSVFSYNNINLLKLFTNFSSILTVWNSGSFLDLILQLIFYHSLQLFMVLWTLCDFFLCFLGPFSLASPCFPFPNLPVSTRRWLLSQDINTFSWKASPQFLILVVVGKRVSTNRIVGVSWKNNEELLKNK